MSATLHLAFASGAAEAGAVIRSMTDTMAELIVAIDGDHFTEGCELADEFPADLSVRTGHQQLHA